MRHRLVRMLGLLGVAVAGGVTGAAAGQALPAGEPVVERAQTSAAPAPALDLRIDPAELPSSPPPPPDPRMINAARADRYAGAEEHSTDRGLSFGVELKPRSPIGRLARKDSVEDPSLTEQLEKVIERPALSLRGRYRF